MKLAIILFLLTIEEFMLPCLTKKFIGIDCPGCGLQRSFILVIHGNFEAAYTMYPAIYSIFLLVSFYILQSFIIIKHANKIILTLTLITVIFITTNYISKFI
ncbi:uncharacterized protein DUF2752 [Maribacter vaceletii]|uniref:Uncharacterized protein DUF2752 n=1 Tax=Maribacter vaceletii TaxID=1206816 RepID=A0A495DSG2_9FLAO|nr:DUF2752 domain-containing protein [Maribacter vaceletii]RKR07076.1 uncharacterized protein DUF2752 [Maribacter vaceletii]